MIDDVRGNAISSIEYDITELSGPTRWGDKPNSEVIKLGTKFCEDLLNYARTSDNMDKVHSTSLFSGVATILVAGTRHFEDISDEELDAIRKIFDEITAIWKASFEEESFNKTFDRIMYVREIFITNTVCREDFDGKYRQSMIFPNFVDLYEIVHKIEANWDKLKEAEDFTMMFTYFRTDWYHAEVRSKGDIMLEKKGLGGETRRPENLPEYIDPHARAREFMKMLDERL